MTGSELRQLRQRYDITQMELAEALHVSSRTINRWEHKDRIPELARLALLELQGTHAEQSTVNPS